MKQRSSITPRSRSRRSTRPITRSRAINVAGPAALLVAKLHKLGERNDRNPARLNDKDAHDVYRLLVSIQTTALADAFARLLTDDISAAATRVALGHLDTGSGAGRGVQVGPLVAMVDPLERLRKARVAGLALLAAGAAWLLRARARERERAEQLAEEQRKARWEAEAPERLLRQQEWEERQRQRHEEFLAAAEAKGWRYEDLGLCHLDKRKKRFATELDARICTWVQREKHGGALQRAYRCDGSDTPDGAGCGSWHLTSKSSFT